MIEDIMNIDSSLRELRKFGVIMAGALVFIGCVLLWCQKGLYPYVFILAGIFLLSGLLIPRILMPLHKVWMTLAVVIGWIMTRMILILLFYLIVTPIALLMRVIGKELLDITFDGSNQKVTYWTPREKMPLQKDDYLRQF